MTIAWDDLRMKIFASEMRDGCDLTSDDAPKQLARRLLCRTRLVPHLALAGPTRPNPSLPFNDHRPTELTLGFTLTLAVPLSFVTTAFAMSHLPPSPAGDGIGIAKCVLPTRTRISRSRKPLG